MMQSLLEQEKYFAMAYECLEEVKSNFDDEIGNRIEGDLISFLCDFTRQDLSSSVRIQNNVELQIPETNAQHSMRGEFL